MLKKWKTRPLLYGLPALVIGSGCLLFLVIFIFSSNGPRITPNNTPLTSNETPSGSQEYLALGDSIAYGVGASSPRELGYAGVFYQQYLLPARPAITSYQNFAIPGETSASFISRRGGQSQLEKALAEITRADQSVKIITLTIGGNDMIAVRGKSPTEKSAALAEFDTNLKTILGRLTGQFKPEPGEKILIVTTYYNPFGNNNPDEVSWARQFNSLITKRATEYKAQVADFYGPLVGRETEFTRIAQGDIHPTQAGHALLAALTWQATGYPARLRQS